LLDSLLEIGSTMEVLHQWLFFFGIVGSVMFFAIRFSRLAQAHGKNKWLFGFIGVGCFLTWPRLLGLLVTALDAKPGYIISYAMLALCFLITYGLYYLLKRNWENVTRS
jgi:hypothetical protein